MFMSVIDNSHTSARYGELAGARVIITGLSPSHGVDIARAFADHKTRLVLQTPCPEAPDTTALVAILAETAHEITVFGDEITTAAAAQKFTQSGTQALGGVDAVINLIAITQLELNELAKAASLEAVEAFVAEKLAPALAITRIAANRMRVTMSEGLILNIVALPDGLTEKTANIGNIVRATLAAITRREAQTWAGNGIRVNAVGPRAHLPGERPSATLASEPEIAAVALYLASSRARQLSGHVFDAEGSLTRCE
jgi:NAD(P)-dependent dehydrogenase (short-subunit alcohol dehydrogenase family)